MARNGGIAIDTMLKALINGAEKVSAEVETMPVSFADAMTRLNNSFQRFVGTADDTYRISEKITKALDWMSNNFANVASAALLAASTALPALIRQVNALAVAIARNPIGAIATAALAATAAIAVFSGEIKIAADSHATLADLAAATWTEIGTMAKSAAGTVAAVWAETLGGASSSSTEFELTWADAFVNIGRSADALGAAMIGTVVGVGSAFGNLGRSIEAMFSRTFNAVIEQAERFLNRMIEAANVARGFVGMDTWQTVSFGRRSDSGESFDPFGAFMREWDAAMQSDTYERRAEQIVRNANQRALGRAASQDHSGASGGVSRLVGIGQADEQHKALEATQKYADALQRQYDATLDLTAAERVLYDLRQGRIVEGAELDRALDIARMIDSAKEQADQERIQLALLTARVDAQRDLNDLVAQYSRSLVGLGQGQRQREYDTEINRIDDRFAGQRSDLQSNRSALELEGKWTAAAQAQYDEHMAIIEDHHAKALAAFDDYWGQLEEKRGSWAVGAREAWANYVDEARNVAKQSEQVFTKAFDGMADALTQFAMTGKADFKSLANSIIADLTRIQIRKAMVEIFDKDGSSGNWLGTLFGAIVGGMAGRSGTPPPAPSGTPMPIYDVGTPFVPRNQVAMVHEGEAIIPASLNPWGRGKRSIGSNITINSPITVAAGVSAAQVDATVRQRNEELKYEILEGIARQRFAV
jgi:lambda family phage tail tape measure protein